MIAIPMTISTSRVSIPVSIAASYNVAYHETYEGPYEFTPTQEIQTAQTADKVLLEDIIIHPIPQNYGLITWNGLTLTVS